MSFANTVPHPLPSNGTCMTAANGQSNRDDEGCRPYKQGGSWSGKEDRQTEKRQNQEVREAKRVLNPGTQAI